MISIATTTGSCEPLTFHRGVCCAHINIFSILPSSFKNVMDRKAKFKVALMSLSTHHLLNSWISDVEKLFVILNSFLYLYSASSYTCSPKAPLLIKTKKQNHYVPLLHYFLYSVFCQLTPVHIVFIFIDL